MMRGLLLAALVAAGPALAGPTALRAPDGSRWTLEQSEDEGSWQVKRLDAAQRPVPGFGRNGAAVLPLTEDDDSPAGLQVDAQGRVWVSGGVSDNGALRGWVMRLTPDGRPDTAWGQQGAARLKLVGDPESRASDVLPQADGTLMVAGAVWGDSGDEQAAVWRLDAAGQIDRRFASQGVWQRPGADASRTAALAAAPDGGFALAIIIEQGADAFAEIWAAPPGGTPRQVQRERLPSRGLQGLMLVSQGGRWQVQPQGTLVDVAFAAPAAEAAPPPPVAAPAETGHVAMNPFSEASAVASAAPVDSDPPYGWAALAGGLVALAGWWLSRSRGR